MCKTDFLYSFKTKIMNMLKLFPISPKIQINTETNGFALNKVNEWFSSFIMSVIYSFLLGIFIVLIGFY